VRVSRKGGVIAQRSSNEWVLEFGSEMTPTGPCCKSLVSIMMLLGSGETFKRWDLAGGC
jgi:hypothetical protein